MKLLIISSALLPIIIVNGFIYAAMIVSGRISHKERTLNPEYDE